MNDNVAAELEQLWKAGAVDLPKAAAAYTTAASHIHRTGLTETESFAREDGSMGDLYPEWSKLRNTLQDNVFGPSYDNLVNAGQTLTHIADQYAADDDDALAGLAEYKREVESGPVNEQPPEHIPSPPQHTDANPPQPRDR